MNYGLKRKKGLNEMKMVLPFFSLTERKKKNVMFYFLILFVMKRKNIHEYKIKLYGFFKIIL